MHVALERWSPTHARFGEVERLAEALGQARNLSVLFDWRASSHVIVARPGRQ